MPPADSASRAGGMPKASRDRSLGTFEEDMTEADWKAFRKMVPELRERYLKKRNAEIAGLLTTPALTDTERFWNTHEKITKEAEILQNCLDGHSRSRMVSYIYQMLADGLMEPQDLAVFSPELQDRARSWYDENIIRTDQSS